MLLIGNATNGWTKSWLFYPHYIGEISKVVFKTKTKQNETTTKNKTKQNKTKHTHTHTPTPHTHTPTHPPTHTQQTHKNKKQKQTKKKKLCHAIHQRNLTQSCLRSIRSLQCARFIQHKLVINARVSVKVFLETTLLISCIVQEIIKILSSRWWRFELATSAIETCCINIPKTVTC